MKLIVDSAALADFCRSQAGADFITVDTEFMRDRTFWPILCLVQVAGSAEAAIIDTLAPGIDLAPLFELLVDPAMLKVFHAARQDIEIFHHLTGRIPAPLVDTQVAAMVCGFGEAVSYESLAGKLAGARIDKSSRFTDWSHRPLTERQMHYALSDVTHLRLAYERLDRRLARTGRRHWVEEEMNALTDPRCYELDPREAWRRLKPRGDRPRFLAILREVAAWRETEAQSRDLPRNRVIRDESLLEIAAHAPTSLEALARSRGLGRGFVEGRQGAALLDAVRRGLAVPETECPTLPPRQEVPQGQGPLVELLRVLLKAKCEEQHVAHRLVASPEDLQMLAADDAAPILALTGWRREVFGEDALALKHGKVALTADARQVKTVPLPARSNERIGTPAVHRLPAS